MPRLRLCLLACVAHTCRGARPCYATGAGAERPALTVANLWEMVSRCGVPSVLAWPNLTSAQQHTLAARGLAPRARADARALDALARALAAGHPATQKWMHGLGYSLLLGCAAEFDASAPGGGARLAAERARDACARRFRAGLCDRPPPASRLSNDTRFYDSCLHGFGHGVWLMQLPAGTPSREESVFALRPLEGPRFAVGAARRQRHNADRARALRRARARALPSILTRRYRPRARRWRRSTARSTARSRGSSARPRPGPRGGATRATSRRARGWSTGCRGTGSTGTTPERARPRAAHRGRR